MPVIKNMKTGNVRTEFLGGDYNAEIDAWGNLE